MWELYNTLEWFEDLNTRMHRPVSGLTEKIESSVLPSPQTYQSRPSFQSDRRVFSQAESGNQVQEDFTYDDSPRANNPDYLQALKDFSNNKFFNSSL